jgi:thiosulfate dehydrogenase [quinone] large subunit
MFAVRHAIDSKGNLLIQDPPIAQFLFQSTKASVIWLVLRLWMAYEWLEAGWHKFTDPAWMETGQGILGYWQRAVVIPAQGRPPRCPTSTVSPRDSPSAGTPRAWRW